MNPTKTTYLLLVLVTLIWGKSFIVIKHAVQFLPPRGTGNSMVRSASFHLD